MYGVQPPALGGAINKQGQVAYKPNPVKHFNNWNMCFSCGWDIPIWHNRKTYPAECCKQGNCDEVDCHNARVYKDAGHVVSMGCTGKTQLPNNPHPGQA